MLVSSLSKRVSHRSFKSYDENLNTRNSGYQHIVIGSKAVGKIVKATVGLNVMMFPTGAKVDELKDGLK
ncbi:MAG TPA: hypothetical protein DEF30_04230 [Proteiniclasticum sp.]|nr:hypothetical protein [Proteiniclasticum sp.]